ncbi:MAG: YabP/YqfC family sporulation protein, partial [Oscillospiraceae bacterium]
EVSMRTSRGMLTVHGEGLRVGRLAIDTGELAIDGAFDALDYTEETVSGSGFWSRLLGDEAVAARSACAAHARARARRGARAGVRRAARAAPPCAQRGFPRAARRRVLPRLRLGPCSCLA